jgi:nitrogen-specific signal transduction histidine kinase
MVRLVVRHREGSRFVEVAISDEGKGISIEDQRRIFQPGFSKRKGGSGLGLPIAQRSIMAHGGRIAVTSVPGGPTTFTVRLPVATRASPEQLLSSNLLNIRHLASRGHLLAPEQGNKEKENAGQGHTCG